MLYREQLDQMQCAEPGCDHTAHDAGLFFHGRCHIESATWAEYRDGKVFITCATCDKPIAVIAVAKEPTHAQD